MVNEEGRGLTNGTVSEETPFLVGSVSKLSNADSSEELPTTSLEGGNSLAGDFSSMGPGSIRRLRRMSSLKE